MYQSLLVISERGHKMFQLVKSYNEKSEGWKLIVSKRWV